MRDIERKIIALIADTWYQYPDWWLTQILALEDSTDRINFFQEDDETLRKLQAFADYMDV